MVVGFFVKVECFDEAAAADHRAEEACEAFASAEFGDLFSLFCDCHFFADLLEFFSDLEFFEFNADVCYFLSFDECAFKCFDKVDGAFEDTEDEEEWEYCKDVEPVFSEEVGDGADAVVFECEVGNEERDDASVDNFDREVVLVCCCGEEDVDDDQSEEYDKGERDDLVDAMFKTFQPLFHGSVFGVARS